MIEELTGSDVIPKVYSTLVGASWIFSLLMFVTRYTL